MSSLKFYIQPYGGLGNRIRTIAASLSLAQDYGAQLIVLWKRDSGLNCRFDRLFVAPKDFDVIEVNSRFYLEALKMKAKISWGLVDNSAGERNNGKYIDCLKRKKTLYLKSFNQYYYPKTFNVLKPLPRIIEKTDSVFPKNINKLIGIHIRRTDHVAAIEHSGTDLFIEAIKKELEADSQTKFFLATDSKEVEDELKASFSDSIIVFSNKDLSRNSDSGIRDAYVEMLCLSRCSKIYGSFDSSFSELAAQIDTPSELVVVK